MHCGTPVYAAHAGTIEIDTTQSWAGPYLVKVTTGPTSLATWYAHMETVTVSRAQTVATGDQIGTTGDLGNSRGCHLHFEVHLENGSIYGPDNVDPSGWLAENVMSDVTARTARTARARIAHCSIQLREGIRKRYSLFLSVYLSYSIKYSVQFPAY